MLLKPVGHQFLSGERTARVEDEGKDRHALPNRSSITSAEFNDALRLLVVASLKILWRAKTRKVLPRKRNHAFFLTLAQHSLALGPAQFLLEHADKVRGGARARVRGGRRGVAHAGAARALPGGTRVGAGGWSRARRKGRA